MEYLVESALRDVIDVLFPHASITPQFPLKIRGELGTKRIDYCIDDGVNKIFVEFDGHLHYSRTLTQQRDILVAKWAKENGIKFVQIPYFVQADRRVMSCLFGEIVSETIHMVPERVDFPHGFISEKCILPADFNAKGIKRFENELEILPDDVVKEIEQSLECKFNEKYSIDRRHPSYSHLNDEELTEYVWSLIR